MTLKQFEEKIVEIATESKYSHQYKELGVKRLRYSIGEEWEPTCSWETYTKKKNVLYSEWSTGGVSGGSCWDSSDPRPYSSDNLPEDLVLLDEILAYFNPNISFLEYKLLTKKLLKVSTRSEYEYYGNSTDYSSYTVEIEELYNYLKEKQWLKIPETKCPYDGVAYSRVPGYVEGYGCPVCKAIGSNHLSIQIT